RAGVRRRGAGGADRGDRGKGTDTTRRTRQDSADSRARNARIAAIQKELAAKAAAAAASGRPAAAAPAPRRARNGDDNGGEPGPLRYAALGGAAGGLTAPPLPAREGLADTVFALLDGGADLNQVSTSDHTSPLLIAAINGHFDLAMRLVARGADVNLASDAGGAPLYGVLNMQWAPKARHPQP